MKQLKTHWPLALAVVVGISVGLSAYLYLDFQQGMRNFAVAMSAPSGLTVESEYFSPKLWNLLLPAVFAGLFATLLVAGLGQAFRKCKS